MIDDEQWRYLEQAVLMYVFVSDQVTEPQLKIELNLDDELYDELMNSYRDRGFIIEERGSIRLSEKGERFIAGMMN